MRLHRGWGKSVENIGPHPDLRSPRSLKSDLPREGGGGEGSALLTQFGWGAGSSVAPEASDTGLGSSSTPIAGPPRR